MAEHVGQASWKGRRGAPVWAVAVSAVPVVTADETPKEGAFVLWCFDGDHVCTPFGKGHHDADVRIFNCLGHALEVLTGWCAEQVSVLTNDTAGEGLLVNARAAASAGQEVLPLCQS